MEAKIEAKKKEDVVKFTECRSSKIKTNNLYNQFSTIITLVALTKVVSVKWERVKPDYSGSRSNGNSMVSGNSTIIQCTKSKNVNCIKCRVLLFHG